MVETRRTAPETTPAGRPTVESIIAAPDKTHSDVDLRALASEVGDSDETQLDAVRAWADSQITVLSTSITTLENLADPTLDVAKATLIAARAALNEVKNAVSRREEALVAARPLTAEKVRETMLNGSKEEWEAVYNKMKAEIRAEIVAGMGGAAAPGAEAQNPATPDAGTTATGVTGETAAAAPTTPEAAPSADEDLKAGIDKLEAYVRANPDSKFAGRLDLWLPLLKIPGMRRLAKSRIQKNIAEFTKEENEAARKAKFKEVIDALDANGIDVELDVLLAKAPKDEGKLDLSRMKTDHDRDLTNIKAMLLYMSEVLGVIEPVTFIEEGEKARLRAKMAGTETLRSTKPELVTEYFGNANIVDRVIAVVPTVKRKDTTPAAPTVPGAPVTPGTVGGAGGTGETKLAAAPTIPTGEAAVAAPTATPEANRPMTVAELAAALGLDQAAIDAADEDEEDVDFASLTRLVRDKKKLSDVTQAQKANFASILKKADKAHLQTLQDFIKAT